MKSGIPAGIVAALGLTQIVGYGTLYYSFSILAPGMARDLGQTVEQVFAVFSASLLVGGLSAPIMGGWMDRFGAATIMTFGSAVSAVALLLCAWSPSMPVFAIAIVLLEVASGMVQYQAAFATLVEVRPKMASRSITYLTLIGGFASTIFWPIAVNLSELLSWREIYVAYAGLNLLICLPLHYWILRSRKHGAVERSRIDGEAIAGALPTRVRRRGMLLVSLAFALQGFTLSAILTHMVPMLGAIGFGPAAVVIGSLFGPSQVLSRLINMTLGANLLPPMLATLSAVLIVAGVVVLGLSGTWLPGAVAFAICLGLGSGINSIAQGSLPLWLFGSSGYGAITGRMAAARLAAAAMAPFVFSVLMERFGINVALMANACLGAIGIAAFVAVASAAKRQPGAH
ncbi:MFS transporter [Sinorhizobium medicae]|uniref:MFS transporter n=1 Tax=Sinorhizobium medicae TaxID=110321 RepID=A0ABX4TJI1_9HYPH|nr:arsenite efflux MFS transporter ArsK [Sinorhizobium medicae]MBO1960970.1 arsenite efflux MFS transporter ArsK [Sinorhizobium medicae]MDX0456263.1 arsenite efflux MFS transporter ArsK [Sinorhizobium medicae]MDX0549258.1 arsenite efflux MFS transporter ArsK [Sinorhizobium medicae]MDX0693435.1 arsenite efflux MFS transporter ArsK [Sinorhizobium medicae]MDX0742272.1 arsenite efflux MFS transporter ArsK [Sinorhizobium medicae]